MSGFSAISNLRKAISSKYRELSDAIEPVSESRKRQGIDDTPPFPDTSGDPDEVRLNEEYEQRFRDWAASATKEDGERARKVVDSWNPNWKDEIKQLLKSAVHQMAAQGFGHYSGKLENLHTAFLSDVESALKGHCDLHWEVCFPELYYAHQEFNEIAYLFEGDAEPPSRLEFDEFTRVVRLDGKPFEVKDSTTFLIFREIASAIPRRISANEIRKRTNLNFDNNTIYRHIKKKLPKQLSKLVDGNNQGRTIVLPQIAER